MTIETLREGEPPITYSLQRQSDTTIGPCLAASPEFWLVLVDVLEEAAALKVPGARDWTSALVQSFGLIRTHD